MAPKDLAVSWGGVEWRGIEEVGLSRRSSKLSYLCVFCYLELCMDGGYCSSGGSLTRVL